MNKQQRDQLRINLTTIRMRRELTQTQLALNTGFKPAAISHFEHGRRVPTLTNLLRLAKGLEVTVGELLKGVE